MKDKIILMLADGEKLSPAKIRDNLYISNSKNDRFKYDELTKCLKELELDGIIYYDTYENRYFTFPSSFLLLDVDVNKKGHMFASVNNKTYDFLSESLPKILPFDRVVAKMHGHQIKVIKVLKRTNPYVICKVMPEYKIRMVGNNNISLDIAKKSIKNLKVGTRILVKLSEISFRDAITCEFISEVCKSEELALAYNNGFRVYYTQEELEQINSLPKKVNLKKCDKYVDHRDEVVFTIDDVESYDLDDAISIKTLEDGTISLSVFIADVAHYIKPGSPLWNRAENLTTSTYFETGAIFHMIHPKISCGICSLNPGVDRLAKGYIFKISPDGEILDFKIENSIIRSNKKMTYKKVDNILNGLMPPKSYIPYINDLFKLQQITKKIAKNAFCDTTISYKVNEDNILEETNVEKSNHPSSDIIATCAVLVGKTLAEHLYNLGSLMVYRNHKNTYYEEFRKLLDGIGYKIKAIEKTDDEYVIKKVIDTLKSKEEFMVFSSLLLSNASKAYYDINNIGHYALDTKAYSHATSPIRRFSDLLIGTILDNQAEIFSGDFDLEKYKNYLKDMAHRCTIMEKCAEKFTYEYYELQGIKEIISNYDKFTTGRITNLNNDHITIKLENDIEGTIYLQDFADGLYKYNKSSKFLYHPDDKDILMPGMAISIYLKDYDLEFRKLYFYGNTLNRNITLQKKK